VASSAWRPTLRPKKTIDHALAQGDYHAVDPLLIAIEKLDRYHGIARRRPADSPEPPPRLEAAVAPLALVYARQEAGAAASPPPPAGPSPRA